MEDNTWIDYLTINENDYGVSNNLEIEHYYNINTESDTYLQSAIDTWSLIYKTGTKFIELEFGNIFQVDVYDRYYLIYVPNECIVGEKYPVVIFLHGLSQSAWHNALKRTGLIELANEKHFIVLFGQGQGEISCPTRDKYGGISFGDIYWNIKNPEIDIDYINQIINLQGEICDSQKEINLSNIHSMFDMEKIFLWGYSNGAMCAFNMAMSIIRIKFAGICSMMGGYAGLAGYPSKIMESIIDKFDNNLSTNVPVIIITGSLDEYNPASQEAVKMLRDKNFTKVELIIIDGQKHSYPKNYEQRVWKFFVQNLSNF
ncbi:putative hydrolase [Cotonvirus japonicus]|uniref:Hydrolase n=1 Tax=Cotonvirus japonicus TaxID=2811091 RepID=A0ABM7NRP0_9VIRU|nr:putative hydrolase [Cotonvirus japonicus]BCS82820.1 putative hydrolase [Cotonvirus japonicus]